MNCNDEKLWDYRDQYVIDSKQYFCLQVYISVIMNNLSLNQGIKLIRYGLTYPYTIIIKP